MFKDHNGIVKYFHTYAVSAHLLREDMVLTNSQSHRSCGLKKLRRNTAKWMQNTKQALAWYAKAAAQGDPYVCDEFRDLGVRHDNDAWNVLNARRLLPHTSNTKRTCEQHKQYRIEIGGIRRQK